MSKELIMGDIFIRDSHCPLLYVKDDLVIYGWKLGKHPPTEDLIQYPLDEIAADWTKVGNIKDILYEAADKGGILRP